MRIAFILFIGLFWQKITINAQCNSASGTNAGTITPTATFQTVSGVNGGNYYIVNANPCKTYTFSFCPAVGNGSASFDTQITVTDLTGAPIAGAYNDDYCGVQSCLVWQPSTSGNVRVYITQYSCQNTGTGALWHTLPLTLQPTHHSILSWVLLLHQAPAQRLPTQQHKPAVRGT